MSKETRDDEFWNMLGVLKEKDAFPSSGSSGMTLREYYIGQALQGALANQFMGICSGDAAKVLAESIIVCVDAMLEEMAEEEIDG